MDHNCFRLIFTSIATLIHSTGTSIYTLIHSSGILNYTKSHHQIPALQQSTGRGIPIILAGTIFSPPTKKPCLQRCESLCFQHKWVQVMTKTLTCHDVIDYLKETHKGYEIHQVLAQWHTGLWFIFVGGHAPQPQWIIIHNDGHDYVELCSISKISVDKMHISQGPLFITGIR